MLKNKGQTTIEYILLLGVIVIILAGISKHPAIKNFMAGGDIITDLGNYMQFSYRHALPGKEKEKYLPSYGEANHLSYRGPSDTRFFGPKRGYP